VSRTKASKAGRYRSPLLASVHETAKGLHDAGVMDKQTMRKLDVMCLTPVPRLTAKQSNMEGTSGVSCRDDEGAV